MRYHDKTVWQSRCKVCDNFDYCERCFYGRGRGGGGAHRHSFSRMAEPGGAAVFAGRPGQTRRRRSDASSTSGLKGAPTPSASSSLLLGGGGAAAAAGVVPGLVEEWGDCVKSMGVSSRESWAYRGAIEKHLTNIMNFHEILKDLKVGHSNIVVEKSN